MPEFDAATERITVFEIGDEYYFSHYFDRTDVFEELEPYYHRENYRFAVPAEDFDDVEASLAENGYELEVVSDLEPYCVVIETYEPHADVLRNSTANWERDGHRFFLMRDALAVERAVEDGATPVGETDFVVGL